MQDAYWVYLILALTLAAFIWGRFRYDLVAMAALLGGVLVGVVPADEAFSGFGHPAVITVAAVLVLSRGFEHAGVVDWIAEKTLKAGSQPLWQLLVLTTTVILLSAIMNNVGALALLLPVAVRVAREHGTSPSLLLMPLAFGSLLGGLITLIGTPPNIIISAFRASQGEGAFRMFDFAPVGAGVAFAGLVFMVLVGWRLTPQRQGRASADELFETSAYLSELTVVESSKAVGWTLRELREVCDEPVPILGIVRGERQHSGHRFFGPLQAGDILLLEAGPEDLKQLEDKGGLTLGAPAREDDEARAGEASKDATDNPGARENDAKASSAKAPKLDTEDLQLVEAVVRTDSMMIRRTVTQLRLLNQHGLHLVAVSRDGARLKQRLREVRFQPGDVLLLQGDENGLSDSLATLGCLPLASRKLSLGQPRQLLLSVAIFAVAIGVMMFDLLPAAIALSLAALVTLALGVLPLREGYDAIEGPVIVLLAAMLPIGTALETSGGAQMVADGMMTLGSGWPPVITLVALFVITLLLSNVINNAAAALLMAPIAASLASGLDVSLDPFLMAVAVSASCAFLTPIGHQSNTLVMGPGGYHFRDYWKLGLPLSLVVMATAIPLILLIWPLS
ncbi:SLC13 family permease [Salinicola socius]|uniref:SLC13 family permease n=1 Tax=Salinicola socius TaxID=404433 RepID=A0A1Q8SQH0_9GAMM|nr:SLC13 family permease [Salinicola socius]OLO03681.1 SLC13 family permease [Salinicola socius]